MLGSEKSSESIPTKATEIHEQIVSRGLRSGAEFTPKKVAAQNGKNITGQLVFEAIQLESSEPPAQPPNDKPDSFKELMRQSIEDAVEIAQAFHGIDVQKIGTAIFIARTKSNGYA